MIIDFHVHIGKKEHWHPWVNELFEKANPELYENFDEIMSPEGLEDYMNKQGVDYAVILAEHSPITTGVVSNAFVESFCKGSKTFIPFASVDPRTDAQSAASLKRLVEEQGFAGLKLYPYTRAVGHVPLDHLVPTDVRAVLARVYAQLIVMRLGALACP